MRSNRILALLSALVYMCLLHRSKCECVSVWACVWQFGHSLHKALLHRHRHQLFFGIFDDACWWPLVLLLLLLHGSLLLLFSQPVIIWLCSFKVYLLISRVSINKKTNEEKATIITVIVTTLQQQCQQEYKNSHTERERDPRSIYSFICV